LFHKNNIFENATVKAVAVIGEGEQNLTKNKLDDIAEAL
jgi:hypothetical protein